MTKSKEQKVLEKNKAMIDQLYGGKRRAKPLKFALIWSYYIERERWLMFCVALGLQALSLVRNPEQYEAIWNNTTPFEFILSGFLSFGIIYTGALLILSLIYALVNYFFLGGRKND